MCFQNDLHRYMINQELTHPVPPDRSLVYAEHRLWKSSSSQTYRIYGIDKLFICIISCFLMVCCFEDIANHWLILTHLVHMLSGRCHWSNVWHLSDISQNIPSSELHQICFVRNLRVICNILQSVIVAIFNFFVPVLWKYWWLCNCVCVFKT